MVNNWPQECGLCECSRESSYDLVMEIRRIKERADFLILQYVGRHYPHGKHDLYAAFLLRGLELTRAGGLSSMITMRNWMFIMQY